MTAGRLRTNSKQEAASKPTRASMENLTPLWELNVSLPTTPKILTILASQCLIKTNNLNWYENLQTVTVKRRSQEFAAGSPPSCDFLSGPIPSVSAMCANRHAHSCCCCGPESCPRPRRWLRTAVDGDRVWNQVDRKHFIYTYSYNLITQWQPGTCRWKGTMIVSSECLLFATLNKCDFWLR